MNGENKEEDEEDRTWWLLVVVGGCSQETEILFQIVSQDVREFYVKDNNICLLNLYNEMWSK